MKFGSVCSGIEAATIAWHGLGWRASWLAEIDKFASAVLAHHYPTVPNLGDMTQIARAILTGEVCAPEVLCGGTPCQAFSVAGLRESLADARGNLTLKFVEIANAIDHVRTGRGEDECIVFWENVPGVLSTKDNAFGCFLAGLAGEDEPLVPPGQTPKPGQPWKWSNAGAVYGPRRAVAWRTLDAQYFGVAQRRRRVFVVASARKGFDPAQVLFEWNGVRRDTAPSREARETAPTIPARSTAGGGLGTDFDCDGGLIQTRDVVGPLTSACGPSGHGGSGLATDKGTEAGHILAFGGNNQSGPIEVATARNACASASGRMDFESETFLVQPAISMQAGAIKTNPEIGPDGVGVRTDNCVHTLEARDEVQAVAFQSSQSDVRIGDTHATLDANNGSRRHNGALVGMQVRRLTPTECERLQGFPDGYTNIPWRTFQEASRKGISYETLLAQRGMTLRGPSVEECPDGLRYKALGNSWAIPNVAWIGRRIHAALRTNPAAAENVPKPCA